MKKSRLADKLLHSKKTSFLLLFVLSVFILLSLWFYHQLNQSQKRRYLSYLAADELRQSSDDLTRMVRTYVVTKDRRYEEMYWDILAIRNGEKARPVRYENIYWDFIAFHKEKPRPDGEKISLLAMMEGLGFTQEEFAKLAEAQEHSNNLVQTEKIAMHAMKGEFVDEDGEFTRKGDPDYEYARSILHDESYHRDKVRIMTPIDEFFVMVNARTETKVKRHSLYTHICVSLVCATMILLLWLWRIELADLKSKEEELRASNQQMLASEQQLRAYNQQLRANELEREKLLKALTAKNKELQSIVYIASHDLKSPLVNIEGFSGELKNNCKQIIQILKDFDTGDEVMQRIMPLTEKNIPESLSFISDSTSKMRVLLDGLLHVSRVGTVDVNIGPLNMNDIVDNVCRSMEFQVKEAEVEVSKDDLPGCVGDAEMINQLFSNLIGNALKYFDPDRKGKIQITGKVENSHSIYCVEDNGIGIAVEHQPKIFELFHRLNPKDSVGGEGLGLTIITRILDRLNGHIRVESEVGKGSKFFVSLPVG